MNMQITAATTDAVFQAADEQMLKAEADYQGFENDLAKQIKHIPDKLPWLSQLSL